MDNKEMVAQNNVVTEGNQAAPQAEVPTQQIPQTQVAAPVAQAQPAQQEGWFKRNWKKLVAGVAAGGALIGSGIVAYKKGKANGIASVPMPQYDDGSYSPLDPNV